MALSSFKDLIDDDIGAIVERPANCEKHGEYTEKGHKFFGGKIIWSGCQICIKAAIEEKENYMNELRSRAGQVELEKRLNHAGIPVRFRDRNLQNFICETPEQRNALQIAVSFVDNFESHFKKGSSLVFSGKAGTGKSHLALAIAQSVMARHTVMYLNAMDAVRMIRDTWRKGSTKSESDVLDTLGAVDLLIIDEVGVQNGTDNEQVLMFDIINRRYRDMKPTILLTNLGKKGFEEYMTTRSFDRLRESGQWVTFEWASYRGRK